MYRRAGSFRIYMNVGYTLSEEQLTRYFSAFGNVIDVYVPKHKSGRNKGFGFTTFETNAELERVLLSPEHVVDGVVVKINRAGPRPEVEAEQDQPDKAFSLSLAGTIPPLSMPDALAASALPTQAGRGSRLYVGGVPDEIGEEGIIEHFSRWGQVVDVYFPGKKGARSVNYCFVTFENWRAAQRACQQSERFIQGRPLLSISIAEERQGESRSGTLELPPYPLAGPYPLGLPAALTARSLAAAAALQGQPLPGHPSGHQPGSAPGAPFPPHLSPSFAANPLSMGRPSGTLATLQDMLSQGLLTAQGLQSLLGNTGPPGALGPQQPPPVPTQRQAPWHDAPLGFPGGGRPPPSGPDMSQRGQVPQQAFRRQGSDAGQGLPGLGCQGQGPGHLPLPPHLRGHLGPTQPGQGGPSQGFQRGITQQVQAGAPPGAHGWEALCSRADLMTIASHAPGPTNSSLGPLGGPLGGAFAAPASPWAQPSASTAGQWAQAPPPLLPLPTTEGLASQLQGSPLGGPQDSTGAGGQAQLSAQLQQLFSTGMLAQTPNASIQANSMRGSPSGSTGHATTHNSPSTGNYGSPPGLGSATLDMQHQHPSQDPVGYSPWAEAASPGSRLWASGAYQPLSPQMSPTGEAAASPVTPGAPAGGWLNTEQQHYRQY